jgi:predicted ATP-grasp superfamily ATP-dependent carboligase
MRAIGPDSRLWENHPIVKEVILLTNVDYPNKLPALDPSFLTIILPLMEWHILKCPRQYLALISNENVIKILAVKSVFNQYMNQAGLSHLTPKSYANEKEIVYPFVLKRVDLNAGTGISLVNSPMELDCLLKQNLWFQKNIFFQEYIAGEREYVSHLICKNGEILWHCSFAYTLNKPHVIRNPVNMKNMSRITVSYSILEIFGKCLKPLNFSGPCNIDFKITYEGALKILEINPRLGGSLMLEANLDLLSEAISCILRVILASDNHTLPSPPPIHM